MIETLTTAVIVLAISLVGLALLYSILLSDQNKRIQRIREEFKNGSFKLQRDIKWIGLKNDTVTMTGDEYIRLKNAQEENKTLCKPDVVFELQKDLQERCDRVIDLKEENTQLKESRDWDYEYIVKVNEENKRLEDENEQLKKENEMIDEQFTDYIDETCGYLKLLSEFSEHIGNKPSSSTYKYFRGKLDGIGD